MTTTTTRETAMILAPHPSTVIAGASYHQADRLDRDQAADFAAALKTTDPLLYLWRLGYDCSQARLVRISA